ncbi:MAG: hypothetical protein WCR58_03880 [Bacteroidales bacterium]|jgi:hypothetical protein|nr:hypothetical protein [Bacteroidales bacterium]MDD3701137.1 hypothetical protein [Bacteroidales bacterium]MDY0368584.1 hypothetical protein [Bacteroidales bacterium]
MKAVPTFLISLVCMLCILFAACRKDNPLPSDQDALSFSTDSVVFDTVFTSLGSITKYLMVYNNSNTKLQINSIFLEKGAQSVFRMNVDGQPALEIQNIEIEAHDSLFVLLRATIDPADQNNPFIVDEDLVFHTNTIEQRIKLIAWGQDAHYILADTQIGGFPKFKIVADSLETTVWTAGKPYVVYGYALINSYGTLLIEAGARIHFHNNSGLWAFAESQLIVEGTLENPVIFQGDRLDTDYKNIPGQWDRIWLMEGRAGFNHEINYAIIRNGFIGIQAESFLRPTENQLNISNTIIENHTGMGLFARLFAIDANNVVIANCGNYNLALTAGGAYRFMHSTIANQWSYSIRNTPALFYNNFLLDTLNNAVPVPFSLEMGNSIIYGSNIEETGQELVEGATASYLFDHCLIRTEQQISNDPHYENCIQDADPRFRDYPAFDYRPDTLSPVIGKGKQSIANQFPYDLNGISRTQSPDLGAYQYVYIPEDE